MEIAKMQIEIPKFLYHYTSIENFALILKNKTIRFTSLNNVDDLTEGANQESEKVGKYFFVSCWTDDSSESLAFWNMYTPQMKGVRIKLPINLFKVHKVNVYMVKGYKDGIYGSIVPQEKMKGLNYWIIPTLNNYIKKVTYTENNDLLVPKIRDKSLDKFSLDTIGLYKSKIWEFQSEWRYMIKIFPKPDFEFDKWDENNQFNPETYSPKQVRSSISIDDIYIDIIKSQFKRMEVVLGPKHTDAEYELVKCLLQVHNPDALKRLRLSELKGKIR